MNTSCNGRMIDSVKRTANRIHEICTKPTRNSRVNDEQKPIHPYHEIIWAYTEEDFGCIPSVIEWGKEASCPAPSPSLTINLPFVKSPWGSSYTDSSNPPFHETPSSISSLLLLLRSEKQEDENLATREHRWPIVDGETRGGGRRRRGRMLPDLVGRGFLGRSLREYAVGFTVHSPRLDSSWHHFQTSNVFSLFILYEPFAM